MGLWLLNNSFSYRSRAKLLKTKTEDKSKDWRQDEAEDAEVKVKRRKNVKVKIFNKCQFLNAETEAEKRTKWVFILSYENNFLLPYDSYGWKKFLISIWSYVKIMQFESCAANNLLSLTSYYTKIELNVI